ncbi:hypothetical protein [Coraliomargarita akajimensis]|uniref:Uncharacterized protein n=1 Tax=Coraliomargarita akajimensis (strain DSM 45221 / IAM 15411 / JCM 23193 / KCTC 12865 / 04OKA010-24) TaxID=583355 RepID=D5EHR0_CORAD|nr:hypothetical protein [Coraliomargarita akajimensis]ADE54101.1 hypothetical protein Caka_1080 [Coraliomargarita akajimensis DSM 45221]
MSIRLILLIMISAPLLAVADLPYESIEWDVIQAHENADYVFSASILWIEPVTERSVTVQGFRLSDYRSPRVVQDFPVVPQRYVLQVDEVYKGEIRGNLQVITPANESGFWILDDRQLEAQHMYDRMVFQGGLEGRMGERGLFLVRERPADGVQVLQAAWPFAAISEGMRALHYYKVGQYESLSTAIEQMLVEESEQLALAAKRIEVLRNEYYEILMVAQLPERRAALLEYIQKLGFDRLWTLEEFIQRNPSLEMTNQTRPSDPYELLWHDASQEVVRLDMVLKRKTDSADAMR